MNNQNDLPEIQNEQVMFFWSHDKNIGSSQCAAAIQIIIHFIRTGISINHFFFLRLQSKCVIAGTAGNKPAHVRSLVLPCNRGTSSSLVV
jgi:hypothetical protein